jgi:NIMA (never in mitosis gene a)-related kinase
MPGLYRKVIRGIYPSLPSAYSGDLAALIKTLLQVNPNMRPNCDGLLEMPIVARNISAAVQEEAAINSPADLLNTIKLPRNLNMLANQLPAP